MNLFNGIKEIIISPSSLFSLIVFGGITALTWHNPSAIGSTALVAFVGIVPAVLAMVEHREEMQSMKLNQPLPPPPDKGQL